MSTATEPASLHLTFFATTNRRSYRCHNCNHSFHISPSLASSAFSPLPFRCPRCHHRHLLPHHTISPLPPSPPISASPNSNHTIGSSISSYYTSDESESDSSLLSFTSPNFYPSTPTLRSFVNSLPIKFLPPNSTPWLLSCSICLEDFDINPNTNIAINELPCDHYFHKGCIEKWLKRNNSCPLCRFILPTEPVSEEGSNQWEEEHEADSQFDLFPTDNARSVRINGAPASDRRFFRVNDNNIMESGLVFEAMHDEEGDTLMMDA